MYINSFQLAFYLTIRKEKIINDNVLFVKLQKKTKINLISKPQNSIMKHLKILTSMAIYHSCICFSLMFFETLYEILERLVSKTHSLRRGGNGY